MNNQCLHSVTYLNFLSKEIHKKRQYLQRGFRFLITDLFGDHKSKVGGKFICNTNVSNESLRLATTHFFKLCFQIVNQILSNS